MAEAGKDLPAGIDDGDLSNLLDSCLDDFNKPLPKAVSSGNQPNQSSSSHTKSKVPDEATKPDSESDAWSEEFKQFSDVMENFITDESELSEIRKLMGNLSQDGGPPIDDENFAQSFAETIRELTQQAQNVPETTPEDLTNLLSGLDIGSGNAGDLENLPDLMPLVQNVMHKLMSKELLYPSIKEIVEKYPGWLSEKGPNLKTEELENFSLQYELMKKICEEFEDESDLSEAGKKKQFENVLQLMQKVQSYGNPPKELVANIGPGVPLDEQGNLQIPGMPQQCVIM